MWGPQGAPALGGVVGPARGGIRALQPARPLGLSAGEVRWWRGFVWSGCERGANAASGCLGQAAAGLAFGFLWSPGLVNQSCGLGAPA